jgi:hypothetical protein
MSAAQGLLGQFARRELPYPIHPFWITRRTRRFILIAFDSRPGELNRYPLQVRDMYDTEPTRLRCDGIQYRGGFIETRLVHAGHVNLETWSIDPNALATNIKWVTDVSDAAVTGNVELELDLRTAMCLADSLHEFVGIESATNGTETICDECGSRFLSSHATMSGLCPECSHYLYDKPNCAHSFRDGRCRRCGWDGSVSDYVATIKGTTKSG